MTRRDILQCAHEPFGDSFYYGPERLSERYENDEKGREASGFAKTTYNDVVYRLEQDGSEVGLLTNMSLLPRTKDAKWLHDRASVYSSKTWLTT